MPEITLSLPAALGALVIILMIGAAVVYFSLQAGVGGATLVEPTLEGTTTPTATVTPTATEQPTFTPIPTETPLPPFDYTVREGETCGVLRTRCADGFIHPPARQPRTAPGAVRS